MWLATAVDDDSLPLPSRSEGPAVRIGPPLRLLIVEDEALVAMDMEAALANAGYEMIGIVDTAREAVEVAQRLKPDVVLMDITLREGNGLEAAKLIMARGGLRLIFVSGNSDPRTLAAARALNPAGFIRKPFASSDLARHLAAALGEGASD